MAKQLQFSLSSSEKEYIDSMLEKIEPEKTKREFRVVNFDSFYRLFDEQEKELIKHVLTIAPP